MTIPFRKLFHRIRKDEKLPSVLPADLAPQHEVFSGNYSSWGDASRECSGYDSSVIFEKAKAAALAVREVRLFLNVTRSYFIPKNSVGRHCPASFMWLPRIMEI